MLQNVSKGLGLAIRKVVRLDEHISAYDLLPALPDLGKLSGQPLDEVFQPVGHVHSAVADALDGPVEAEGGKQPGRPAVAVQEWVDMHKLELGDAAHQHG